jgi:hypothetical protein
MINNRNDNGRLNKKNENLREKLEIRRHGKMNVGVLEEMDSAVENTDPGI